MGEFYRQEEGGTRKLLAKEKKELFQARSSFIVFLGGGQGLSCRLPFLSLTGPGGCGGGMQRAHVTDCLIGADQKIPNWQIKITFLVRAESVIKSDVKSRICIMGFSTSDTILDMWLPL